MNETQQFDKMCQAMSKSAFYSHEVHSVQRRETHISVVFLTGKWVYKIKKPLNLEFLDFRKLSDRKHFCEQEVLLNQRLSSGIYAEVVDIVKMRDGNVALGSDGDIIDHAVKMVQLPEEQNLDVLLTKGLVTPDQVESLGIKLADFYKGADRSPHIDTFGDPGLIRYNMEENFRQIHPFTEKIFHSEKWEFICQVSRSFLKDHEALFRHRMENGHIKDGHGDLRCDHVYFYNGIQIIDCIEFNDRFRYGDTALDLAFLIMDLEHRGYSEIAHQLLAVYAEAAQDPEIYALLDFYAAYRALVRLKVTCFSLEQTGKENQAALVSEIRRYLNHAYHYALLFGRPTLWLFCGLPASGKSTIAEKIADMLKMPLFQSDIVRKQDQKTPSEEVVAFNTGRYQPVLRGRVYAELLNLAQEQLKNGHSVALDATFSDAKWQDAAVQLAEDMDVNLIVVQCICKTETIQSRLAEREVQSGQSDARLIHFKEIEKNSVPFKTGIPNTLLNIDTDRPLVYSFYDTLSKAYTSKCAQTRTLLNRLNNGEAHYTTV